MPVALDLMAGVLVVVGVQELPRQVVDQLTDLPFLPCVLALIEVDGVFSLVEQLPDGTSATVDGLGLGFCGGHAVTLFSSVACQTWPISPSPMRAVTS